MTEQLAYEVVGRLAGFELRRYADYVVAETVVTDSFESAGNKAFRTLAGHISGRNGSQRSVSMTAPVLQEGSAARSTVAFVMPSSVDPDRVPVPRDPAW